MNISARIWTELRGDKVIWMIVTVLAIISVLSVYSATDTLAFKYYQNQINNSFLIRHTLILIFGLMMTYLAYLTHYARYKNIAPWLMLIVIPLLVLTLAIGVEINDARRWLRLPFGFTFQTSDMAKLALILFVAREITKHKNYISSFKNAFMPIIVPILLTMVLIAPEDLSTALLLFFTCILMMFIGGIDWKYIALTLLLGTVVLAALIIVGELYPSIVRIDTWATRIRDFIDTEDTPLGYQVQHSYMAIANGGLIGVGPGNGIMADYLPAPYSDFIYATIVEEYGLIGALIVISMYMLLLFRVISLVTKSDKSFGAMAALGITLILVLQALINMSVTVGLVPVTGLTLPLVSMGGTSIIFTCISVGIILSVSKYVESSSTKQKAGLSNHETDALGQTIENNDE